MNEQISEIISEFSRRIDELYSNIDSWLSSYGLTALTEEPEINEENSGIYKVNQLAIYDKEEKIARMMPVGAWVIGANGRVDLIGKFDRTIIVYIEKEGSSLTTTIKDGDRQETFSTQFYKGIEETGWYWIENRRHGKAHLLDKELFLELLSEVSDYEF